MEITGTVRGDPALSEGCCIFPLEGKDGLYLILSRGRQAGKDAIFIERGQKVQIKGSVLGQDCLKRILVTESARIVIARNGPEKEAGKEAEKGVGKEVKKKQEKRRKKKQERR